MTTAAPSRRRSARRGKGRPTAADAAVLPGRLLDAALRVFVSHGFAHATMDAIAREAGVSRKTLYARHPGKADVLRAVVKRLLDDALEPHASKAAPDPTQAPRQVLVRLGRELASLSSAENVAGLNRLILGAASRAPELARLFTDLHERAVASVAATVSELQESGRLARTTDARTAAHLFIEMTASVPRLRAMLGRPLSRAQIDAHVRAAVDLFVDGCGARRDRRDGRATPNLVDDE